MKRIGIYAPSFGDFLNKWDENSVLGGSETWAQCISDEFVKLGYEVYLFCNCLEEHISKSGVHYFPLEMFEEVNKNLKYDYMILSRSIDAYSDSIPCDNIYLIVHDNVIMGKNFENIKKIKKVACLSDSHKMFLMHIQPELINCRNIFKTSNGVDKRLYEDIPQKKNQMVWSMTLNRGLSHFLEKIFPLIKQSVPDFELIVCSYNDTKEWENKNIEGVHFVGKLSKEELSQRQKESKIWVYPCHYENMPYKFRETFCITAIENAMAKNAIIAANIGGVGSIFKNTKGLYGDEIYWYNDEWYANEAIKCLTDEEYRMENVDSHYQIAEKYTWENAAMEWLVEWGEPNKEAVFKRAKIIKLFKHNNDTDTEFYKEHCVFDISDNIKDSDYIMNDYHNKHHLKQEWHYDILLPFLDKCLDFGFSKEDFVKIKTHETKGANTFLIPKKLPTFLVKYYDMYWDRIVQESWTAFLRENKMTYWELCPLNKIKNPQFYCDCVNSSYHEQYYFSHQCVKIKNEDIKNDRTLIISCDSHGIPSIPILCCYFKTVIVLDKRYNLHGFRDLCQDEKITDFIILDGIHSLDYYTEHNFS